MKIIALEATLALAISGATAAGGSEPVLVYPTSVAVEASGTLLVVENGRHRLVRIDQAGSLHQLAVLTKPYAAVETAGGRIFVTDGPTLARIDPGKRPVTITRVEADIGPLALGNRGELVFTTATRLYRLSAGARTATRIANGVKLGGPHGVATTADGSILVSDTDHGRILRIHAGRTSTYARVPNPRGIAVGADGTVYTVAADAKRILRLRVDGHRAFVGPRFEDPYALALGSGALEVVDTGPAGTIRRVTLRP
jgi:DNA-binding beta-propeller fold protein YncE